MKKGIWITLAAFVLAVAFSPSARADALYLNIGGVICDNSSLVNVGLCTAAGFTTSVNGNVIIYNGGTINGYAISSITLSGNGPGTPLIGSVTDTKSDLRNVSGTSLVIDFAAYDFTLPPGPTYDFSASHTANWVTSASGDSAAFTAWADDSNTTTIPGGVSVAPATLVSTGGITGSLAANSPHIGVSLTPTYSLKGRQVITEAVGSQGSFTGSVALVQAPEPASLLLLGVGLFGGGLLGIRRRK